MIVRDSCLTINSPAVGSRIQRLEFDKNIFYDSWIFSADRLFYVPRKFFANRLFMFRGKYPRIIKNIFIESQPLIQLRGNWLLNRGPWHLGPINKYTYKLGWTKWEQIFQRTSMFCTNNMEHMFYKKSYNFFQMYELIS